MKSAIVGCGVIAEMHAKVISLREDSTLIAVADTNKERAIKLANDYKKNSVNAYETLEEMIENESIDVLHICTPHDLHVPMAVYALEKGIHVFMEKPPAISRQQFKLLENVKSNKKLGFCFQNRYNDSVKYVNKLIHSPEAGEIKGGRAVLTWCRPKEYYTESDWRGTLTKEGGGALINQAIHTLDLLVQFLGKPKWAEATMSNHHLKNIIEVEDTVEAYIQFEKCPVSFYATTAYCANVPAMMEIYCENMVVRTEEDIITLIYPDGNRKIIDLDEENIGKSYWGNGHISCINEFYESIKSGQAFSVDYDSVKDSFSLMMDIYESAKMNGEVVYNKSFVLSGFADEIDADFDKQIQVLQDCKMSYMELRSAYGKNISEYSLEEAKDLKDKLDKSHIKVSAIGSPIGKIDITDDFDEHFNLYRHVVDLAKLFETKYIRIFSFYIPEDKIAENYKDEVFRRLEQMISYAKSRNVILLHENEKEIYGDTIVRCKEIMDKLYCDNFKAIFDFANFIQSDQNPLEAYFALKPYIAYVHVKDAKKDSHKVVPAGMGDGHIAEIINLLKADNYNGFYSLEPHLQNFVGLQQLEREGSKTITDSEMTDGEEAFKTAYNAFIKIMEG